MPSAVRLGDKTTGHSCWPPTTLATASSNVIINGIGSVRISDNIVPHCCPAGCHGGQQSSGSPNVNVNGIPVHRQGDSWAVHCNPTPSCHDGALTSGSGTVFVNGKPIGRIGDPISCGDTVAQGAGTVFAN